MQSEKNTITELWILLGKRYCVLFAISSTKYISSTMFLQVYAFLQHGLSQFANKIIWPTYPLTSYLFHFFILTQHIILCMCMCNVYEPILVYKVLIKWKKASDTLHSGTSSKIQKKKRLLFTTPKRTMKIEIEMRAFVLKQKLIAMHLSYRNKVTMMKRR